MAEDTFTNLQTRINSGKAETGPGKNTKTRVFQLMLDILDTVEGWLTKLNFDIDANGKRITNLPAAVGSSDAMRKQEFDDHLAIFRTSNLSKEFLSSGLQIFNYLDVLSNTILSSSTGIAVTSSGWSTSVFIRIKLSTTYIFKLARRICWYDANYVWISTTDIASEALTTANSPLNAAFMRFSCSMGLGTTNNIVSEGTILATDKQFKWYLESLNGIQIFTNHVNDPTIASKTYVDGGSVEYEIGKNKANKATFTNEIVGLSGIITADAGWRTSGKIYILPGTVFTVNKVRRMAFYTGADVVTGIVYDINPEAPLLAVVAPEGCVYLKYSTAPPNLPTTQLEYNATVTSYESYAFYIRKKNNIPVIADTTQSQIKSWFIAESYELTGTIAYDDAGNINTPAAILWPDGATGVLTLTRDANLNVSTYNATYLKNSTSYTITQPTVTRDSLQNIIVKPSITII